MIKRKDVIAFISDDIEYINTLFKRKSVFGFPSNNKFQQAHVARIIAVFGCISIEAQYRLIVKELWPDKFPDPINIKIDWHYFKTLADEDKFTISDKTVTLFKGLQELRNIIAHGLTEDNARDYEEKKESIERASLPVNPMELNDNHSEQILVAIDEITNIFGMLRCSKIVKK